MGGYKNRILRINLTDRSFSEESLSKDLIYDYIGGRGFGIKLLYDDLKQDTDPLGEANELIFIAGPLAGTNAQSFGRWKVFFKSPLTGTYFMSSAGGHWAEELKLAGFDTVIIKGTSELPVYLWINNGHYELRDARYLWGLDCDDTHTLIRQMHHDQQIRIACIGPAGENIVKYAGIFTDRRAAGRGGGGAVMGSKNLKAVAVRGHEKVEIADPQAFKAAVKEQIDAYRTNATFPSFAKRGTQFTMNVTNVMGMFPTRNCQEGVLPAWESIEASEYDERRILKTACSRCMVQCGSITKTTGGKYSGAWSEGPQYETIWSFSGPIVVSDVNLTIAANQLCANLGLDTISTGVSIGFAYELYEKGLITNNDTSGLKLTFGNGEPVIELIRQIAYREGFGDILADGVCQATRRIGRETEQYAMHVKGLEIPGYDPRGAKAMGLNYITAPNGADHVTGYSSQEMFGVPIPEKVDRFAIKNKAELTKWNQDRRAFSFTGIACEFGYDVGMTPEIFAKLISAATGVRDFANPTYLWQVGERIFNLERMFNVREGFDRKDDVLPDRFTREPLPFGPSAGQIFEMEPLLTEYYKAREWDLETGIPTKSKLNELGLSFTMENKL